MTDPMLTVEDLRRLLREAAGEEGATLDGDILDRAFDDLGYDSIALLETSARIEREFGVALDDSTVSDVRTPRALLEVVNKLIADDRAA